MISTGGAGAAAMGAGGVVGFVVFADAVIDASTAAALAGSAATAGAGGSIGSSSLVVSRACAGDGGRGAGVTLAESATATDVFAAGGICGVASIGAGRAAGRVAGDEACGSTANPPPPGRVVGNGSVVVGFAGAVRDAMNCFTDAYVLSDQ